MNVVKILTTDTDDNNFKAQVIRDIVLLQAEWPLALSADSQISPDLAFALKLDIVSKSPELCLVYSTDGRWPKVDDCKRVVRRDLFVTPSEGGILDAGPHVGYYLKPQGRFGPNLTQQYLNRAYPKGRGVPNMIIKLLWG